MESGVLATGIRAMSGKTAFLRRQGRERWRPACLSRAGGGVWTTGGGRRSRQEGWSEWWPDCPRQTRWGWDHRPCRLPRGAAGKSKGEIAMRWMRWSLVAMFTGIFLCSLSAPVRAERLVVMMDWILNGKHSPWFAGVKKGLYKAEGLDPEILRGRGVGQYGQGGGHRDERLRVRRCGRGHRGSHARPHRKGPRHDSRPRPTCRLLPEQERPTKSRRTLSGRSSADERAMPSGSSFQPSPCRTVSREATLNGSACRDRRRCRAFSRVAWTPSATTSRTPPPSWRAPGR